MGGNEHVIGANEISLARQLMTYVRCDNDAGADGLFSCRSDSAGHGALGMSDQVGENIRIQEISKRRCQSTLSSHGGWSSSTSGKGSSMGGSVASKASSCPFQIAS